jgi:hypothetical protein
VGAKLVLGLRQRNARESLPSDVQENEGERGAVGSFDKSGRGFDEKEKGGPAEYIYGTRDYG